MAYTLINRVFSLWLKGRKSQAEADNLAQAVMLHNKSNLRTSMIPMSIISVTYQRDKFVVAQRPVKD
jgi:hypothetical protein